MKREGGEEPTKGDGRDHLDRSFCPREGARYLSLSGLRGERGQDSGINNLSREVVVEGEGEAEGAVIARTYQQDGSCRPVTPSWVPSFLARFAALGSPFGTPLVTRRAFCREHARTPDPTSKNRRPESAPEPDDDRSRGEKHRGPRESEKKERSEATKDESAGWWKRKKRERERG